MRGPVRADHNLKAAPIVRSHTRWRLGNSSAGLSSLVPGGFAFQTPLLSLFTARNAGGARKVGGAQVKEDGMMGRGVTGPKCKVHVVELVAAM